MNIDLKLLENELELTGNMYKATNGVVLRPASLDEDIYYYYVTAGNDCTIKPVQLVGGVIQRLEDVDGKASTTPLNARYIFTLKGKSINGELQKIISSQGCTYDSYSYMKYIEAARQYQELRKRFITRIIQTDDEQVLYQGEEIILPTTMSRFSMGYNEDSYIKSSIAYEIEMYMRAIFSQYGILDADLRDIFPKHNLREAFLKLPRTIRNEIYRDYRFRLKEKTIKKGKYYLQGILESQELAQGVNDIAIQDTDELILSYEKIKSIDPSFGLTEKTQTTIDKLILRNNNVKNKNSSIDKIIEEQITTNNGTSIRGNNNTIGKIENKNLNNMIFKLSQSIESYKNYETLDTLYSDLMRRLKTVNGVIYYAERELKKYEAEILGLEAKKKKTGNLGITEEEYNKKLKEYYRFLEIIKEQTIERSNLIEEINKIEDEMTEFIFRESIQIETAYQDNRYTYERENNNNYELMLIFLESIRKVATGMETKKEDYDELLFETMLEQDKTKRRRVINAGGLRIEDFDEITQMGQGDITINRRNHKKGKISKFFKATTNHKLDAQYSAELKYLGALLVKDLNLNLYMAELGIASELYLKSIIRSNETGHKLHDLYLKVDNVIKSRIRRKVNKLLGVELTHNELIQILESKNINEAFSEYRYLYERNANKKDIDFLSAFTYALHVIVSNNNKYRTPYYDEIEKLCIGNNQNTIKK